MNRFEKCMQAVEAAAGRRLTLDEAEAVFEGVTQARERYREARKMLKDAKPENLTEAELWKKAAGDAAAELENEALKKKQRVALAIIVRDQGMQIMNQAKADGRSMFHGLADMLERTDVQAKGTAHRYFSELMDAIQATSPRFFGLIEDARGVRDLVKEMFGEGTGNEAAAKGARAWKTVTEAMRERWNRAGGETAYRKDWHLPQPHDAGALRAAGMEKWIRDTLPLLKRSRYGNGSEGDVTKALTAAYQNIASEGLTQLEPAEMHPVGMLARRRAESRELHFKDADSYLKYMAEYGRGSVYTAMQAHVSGLARDISLAESLGPNAQGMFTYLHDVARKSGGTDLVGPFFVSTRSMWDTLSGHTSQIFNGDQVSYQRIARVSQGIRNVETATKLQSAMLSAITDIPTYFATTFYNRLPILESVANLLRAFNKLDSSDRSFADTAGLVSDSVISDMNRWAEDSLGTGWTGRLSNATMKLSLMNAWTDAIKRAFSVTMMSAFGKLAKTDWGALNAADRARMEKKGITADDWAVLRMAEPEQWKGRAMLTPEAIKAIPDELLKPYGLPQAVKDKAISKLLGVIVDESEYASVTPDLYTRAALTRGTQKGALEGEFLRMLALFKSFPFAMISRHWRRAFDMEGAASGVGYGASLAVGVTLFGAIALQAKDVVTGKDPRRMDDPKFWAAAFAQGGGAGILGDMVYTGMGGASRYGAANWQNLAGPVFSDVFDLGNLTLGNIREALQGKQTDAGAEAVRFIVNHTPLIRLWYAKAAVDHAVLQDLQEQLSPGYLSRMRERVKTDWGQDWWWKPGEAVPERAPEFQP